MPAPESLRVLVTGATGFVGFHTAMALHAAGHELRFLVRSEQEESQPSVAVDGTMALLAALKTARLLGATGAQPLAYATSADGDPNRHPGQLTVGYLAAAIYG